MNSLSAACAFSKFITFSRKAQKTKFVFFSFFSLSKAYQTCKPVKTIYAVQSFIIGTFNPVVFWDKIIH